MAQQAKEQVISGRSGGKKQRKNRSRSSRADLQFPVGRIHRLLRKGNFADRVSVGARTEPGASGSEVRVYVR